MDFFTILNELGAQIFLGNEGLGASDSFKFTTVPFPKFNLVYYLGGSTLPNFPSIQAYLVCSKRSLWV